MKIGIIGGTGLDDPAIMSDIELVQYDYSKVPVVGGKRADYGKPSGHLVTGKIGGVECALLARHGQSHSQSPTFVNYRANLLLLQQYGCDVIIATYSVGSLREDIAPGDCVIMDQLIDRTSKRTMSYFDNGEDSWPGVCHVSFGEPYDGPLSQEVRAVQSLMDFTVHDRGTCVVIEGPRFSTRAESTLFAQWGGDVIGMTEIPEAPLARELGLPLVGLGMVTDYDAWRVGEVPVTQADINSRLAGNRDNMVKLLTTLIPRVALQKDTWTKCCPGEGAMLSS